MSVSWSEGRWRGEGLAEIESSAAETVRRLGELRESQHTDELVFNLKALGSQLLLFLENSAER